MASMDVQGLEILSGQHAASPDHQTAKANLSRLRRRAETAGDHQRARPHHLAQTTGALGIFPLFDYRDSPVPHLQLFR